MRSLINTGITVLRPPVPDVPRTIIVLGAARGGTSMIAGLLHEMGVVMGERLDRIVFEDMDFSGAVESGDQKQIDALIRDRNEAHDVWGWKRPANIEYIGKLHQKLRVPHYIAVFRDIGAIAVRNRISARTECLVNMRKSLGHYLKIVDFLESIDAPAMLLSYEKSLLNGEALVDNLAEFAGIPQEQIPEGLADEVIKVNLPEYLDVTRTDRITGRLAEVRRNRIQGWAVQRGQDSPLTVRLIVNGKVVARTEANVYRESFKSRGIHPTGHCGFDFRLPREAALKKGDVVRVRVRGDVKDLNGSPRRFKS